MIVKTAISRSRAHSTKKSVIVCEDIDVLVLIPALVESNDRTVYCLKLAKGRQTISKLYSSNSLNSYPYCKENILFIHAVSGADTTSCLYGRGKQNIFETINQKMQSDEEIKNAVESFKNPNQSKEQIFQNGIKCLLAIYKAPKRMKSLNALRFHKFSRSVVNKKTAKLASLPPTEDAARYHCYRVYFQDQKWLSNELPATEWGWEVENNLLRPLKMKQEPASQDI